MPSAVVVEALRAVVWVCGGYLAGLAVLWWLVSVAVSSRVCGDRLVVWGKQVEWVGVGVPVHRRSKNEKRVGASKGPAEGIGSVLGYGQAAVEQVPRVPG